MDAGLDVARLNFSHGTHDDHAQMFGCVREVAAETGKAVGILADLQGPKIRLGVFGDGPVVVGYRRDRPDHRRRRRRQP